MKRFALFSLFASCLLLLNGCVGNNTADTSNCRIRFRSFIDGCDVVKIRGDQVWFVHKAYELPGHWMGCEEPSFVNGSEKWFPNWDGSVSDRYTIEDKERALPLKREFTAETLKITIKGDLGNVFVSEYPNEENDFTLAVTLDDRSAEGASWYEIGIDWDDEEETK